MQSVVYLYAHWENGGGERARSRLFYRHVPRSQALKGNRALGAARTELGMRPALAGTTMRVNIKQVAMELGIHLNIAAVRVFTPNPRWFQCGLSFIS